VDVDLISETRCGPFSRLCIYATNAAELGRILNGILAPARTRTPHWLFLGVVPAEIASVQLKRHARMR
jgi:hypothetical protein